jgi:3-dehydroquinate synthase
MTERVRVFTKSEAHDYDVVIEPGCLDHLAEYVRRGAPAHVYAIIADSNVGGIYGERAVRALQKTGARIVSLQFPAGESSKSTATGASLCDQLITAGISRDSCVIALGGGVTGDLAGFVAATYMRGIPVVQVPTTLLAMIDAAIGGKTGVDAAGGKNLIGAFHQPLAVLVDPHVLRTLPDAELRFGLAEAIKHGAIADAAYVAWIADAVPAIFEHKIHTLASLITRSIEIKAHFVSEDVHEHGARAALNFGHTIAHALERVTDYRIAHGDAVAAGMLVEAAAGELAGITAAGCEEELRRALAALKLPMADLGNMDSMALLDATRTDKKTRAGEQRYTLLARMGEVARDEHGNWTAVLPDSVVREALTRLSVK